MTTDNILIDLGETSKGQVPDWIHLCPSGRFATKTGGRTFTLNDPDAVVRESMPPEAKPIPVDYNHAAAIAAEKGGEAPAAGWITAMQVRKDGIWGQVEWTDKAKQEIEKREYRYISPVIASDADDDVKRIINASLTNLPNLPQLVSLNTQTTTNDRQPGGLDQFVKAICAEMQLPDSTTTEQILAALRKIMRSRHTVDPSKYVPMELFQTMAAKYNQEHSGVPEKVAKELVSRHVQEMRIPVWVEEWAVSLCTQNYTAYQEFVENAGAPIKMFYDSLTQTYDWSGHRRRDLEMARGQSANTEAGKIYASMGVNADDINKYGAK